MKTYTYFERYQHDEYNWSAEEKQGAIDEIAQAVVNKNYFSNGTKMELELVKTMLLAGFELEGIWIHSAQIEIDD